MAVCTFPLWLCLYWCIAFFTVPHYRPLWAPNLNGSMWLLQNKSKFHILHAGKTYELCSSVHGRSPKTHTKLTSYVLVCMAAYPRHILHIICTYVRRIGLQIIAESYMYIFYWALQFICFIASLAYVTFSGIYSVITLVYMLGHREKEPTTIVQTLHYNQ